MDAPPDSDLHYGGDFLDRASQRRFDADWIQARLDEPETWIVPLWRNRNLVAFDDRSGPAGVIPTREQAETLLRLSSETVFLGMRGERAVFTVDLSAREEVELADLLPPGQWLDLRRLGPSLGRLEAALFAYARGMCHWHRNHRFCGRCGAPTQSGRGGHVRICANERCAREAYPRTDPAVIMLVERPAAGGRPPQCLLASHQRLPSAVYTTLAGFVEPGERLEDAVAREVAEETGIGVSAVRYFGSQPWPFPSQLMVGFRAQAISTDLVVDPDEIRHADWFGPEAIDAAGDWGDEGAGLQLPRSDSIARRLIEAWLAEVR